MRPRDYKEHFIGAVVRRSGICRATVEQVLPAVLDEIRYQLSEGFGFVPIESFGTFAIVDIPERQYHYTYKCDRIINLPPTKRIKFLPTRNLRNEINAGQFDPTRRSFTHDSRDPLLRKKKDIRYRNDQKGFWRAAVKGMKPQPKEDTEDEA